MAKYRQYDTVKDKDGKLWRIVSIEGDKYTLGRTDGQRGMPGKRRTVDRRALDEDYTKLNLPPVEVKKIDDLSGEKSEKGQDFENGQKTPEKQKQAVTEANEQDGTYTIDAKDTQIAALEADVERLRGKVAAYEKAEADLREINRELGEEIAQLKRQAEQTGTDDVEDLRVENTLLTGTDERLKDQIHELEVDLDRADAKLEGRTELFAALFRG